MHETKYMLFRLVAHKPKTTVWNILSKSSEAILGKIMWYAPWRQYCFFPDQGGEPDELIFNAGCLEDITTFLTTLNKKQRGKDLRWRTPRWKDRVTGRRIQSRSCRVVRH